MVLHSYITLSKALCNELSITLLQYTGTVLYFYDRSQKKNITFCHTCIIVTVVMFNFIIVTVPSSGALNTVKKNKERQI